MKTKIRPFNWQTELVHAEKIYSIGNDFMLLDKAFILNNFYEPFKVDITTAIICTKGASRGKINLKPYNTVASSLTVVLEDQILQHEYMSEDFEAYYIVMSKRFMDSLNIQERLPILLSVHNNPIIPLEDGELQALLDYYAMLKRAIMSNTPNQMEVARYLTLALFYGLRLQTKDEANAAKKTRQEEIVEEFMALVQEHYKEERSLSFYADKLYLTARHLSHVVKENTGMSASDWIDNYVILEAKALLKSTNMTIQQVSDELNFPTQSFFGKYFKRVVGISPKEYKSK